VKLVTAFGLHNGSKRQLFAPYNFGLHLLLLHAILG